MSRAKFRVLQINQYFNSKPFTQGVKLRPVMAKSSCYPDASEENAYFWDATPSGEAGVSTEFGSDEFEGGVCYYIDMTPDPNGKWKLESVSRTVHQLDIRLVRGYGSFVQMSIGNKGAWPQFLDEGPGSKWELTFSKAPETGENEPY